MILTQTDLAIRYSSALRKYLSHCDEESLTEAYSIGRQAIADGIGVMELAVVHHEVIFALASEFDASTSPQDFIDVARNASNFYLETLTPYEISQKGFKEATEFVRDEVRFSAVLAHELMTPITSISAAAGMLKEVNQSEPGTVESRLVNNVIDGINILNLRASELIDLVRLQSGALIFKMEATDIGELVRKSCGDMEPVITQAGMKLNIRTSRDLPELMIDPGRMRQVIGNLVQNGIQHASEGGRLDVNARLIDNSVQIKVRDYGDGITENVRSRLFRPDMALRPLARQNVSGLGIGLRLCHFIVQEHGGSISMEPARGGGSVFKVSLPVHDQVPTDGETQ